MPSADLACVLDGRSSIARFVKSKGLISAVMHQNAYLRAITQRSIHVQCAID